MNIKTALKQKNKLAKEIQDLFNKIRTYNSTEVGTERPYDVSELMKTYEEKVKELVTLKEAIHRANSKVYGKIFLLSELKSMHKNLSTLDCTSGKASGGYRAEPVLKDTIISVLQRDTKVKEIERQIEQLQDELDQHNAKQRV